MSFHHHHCETQNFIYQLYRHLVTRMYVDSGNNNIIPTKFRANYLPDGIDFGGVPTGGGLFHWWEKKLVVRLFAL